MDDTFMRELMLFVAIIGIFVATVPFVLRGRMAPSIDPTIGGGHAARREADDDDEASAGGEGQIKVSRKRKARARDTSRKPA